MTQKILIISGPTASGKSALALELADSQDIAIINADSLQIYQGLPIISSQPSNEEQKKVKHFLYSALTPFETSSVGMWLKLVKSAVEDSWQQNKLPVIVGGSGMYISKLVEGICEIPFIDETVRANARELFEEIGAQNFKAELLNLGEEKERILNLDKQRLIRAYEVLKQTEKSFFWWQNQPNKMLFAEEIFTHINLNPNREKLYKTCNSRFELMMKNGAIAEVENLLDLGITEDAAITKTLGFIEITDFLEKRISEEEAINIASQKTRNYAKRQLTWFRNQLPNKLVFGEISEALNYLKDYEI